MNLLPASMVYILLIVAIIATLGTFMLFSYECYISRTKFDRYMSAALMVGSLAMCIMFIFMVPTATQQVMHALEVMINGSSCR